MAYISSITLPDGVTYDIKSIVDGAGNTIATYYLPKANVASKGGQTQPVYFDANGVAQPTTYTLNASVPSNAVFTDTKNTAGSTNSTSKLFLVGATTQAANPQTYSDDDTYVTDGTLRTGKLSLVDAVRLEYSTTNSCLNFVFS